MIYSKRPHRDAEGEWLCPFPPDWVEKMRHAAKVCEQLTAEEIQYALNRETVIYKPTRWDVLGEPQDARGLPLSWCKAYDERHLHWPQCCVATYDYDSIPEMVITNGKDDWPLNNRGKVLQA